MAVVCGTDFSELSAHAVDVAAAISLKLGEPLKLVHAFDVENSLKIINAAHEVLLTSVRQHLRSEAERLRARGIEVHDEVIFGTPDERIVDYAERVGASMIVVASLGWRSMSRWTVGSVAEKTVQTARCPVLVVRDALPFVQWAAGDRALEILLAIDLSVTSEAAVRWLAELRRVGEIKVTAAHVGWPFEGVDDDEDSARARLVDQLETRLEQLGESDLEVELVMNAARPADALAYHAARKHADLLVLGMHRRGGAPNWHGSIPYAALHIAEMSVACVPAEGRIPSAEAKPHIRFIVVPTDFSERAATAIPYACSLLARGGALHLVHVISSQSSTGTAPAESTTPEESLEVRYAEAVDRMAEVAERCRSEWRVEVSAEVLASDDVVEGIAMAADGVNADLICVASNERSSVPPLSRPSLAQSLVSRSRRAVLVVRPGMGPITNREKPVAVGSTAG